jgi:DNA invertase Pin-like site-specific DNA recombinase
MTKEDKVKKHIEQIVKSYEGDEMGYTLDDAVLDVAVYVRVSTSGQTTENQLIELSEVCERNKWHITNVYNETISGTKGIDERAELNRMMQDASRKQFSKVVVWSVDRVGRSMKHLVTVLSQLKDLGCDIYSYKQAIDTSTTMGSSFFHMVGIFAELENNMRAERQKIGIRRALENGAKFGRKSIMTDKLIKSVVRLRESSLSMRKIATQFDISTATVQKALKMSSQVV